MDIEVQINSRYKGYKVGLSASGLNKFVVLTGLNGAGKSQLLQILEEKSYINGTNPQARSTITKDGVVVRTQKVLGIFDWNMPSAPVAGAAERQNLSQAIFHEVTNNLPPRGNSWNQQFSEEQHNALIELAQQFAREGFSQNNPPAIDSVLDRLPEDFEKQSSQIINERIASIIYDWHFARRLEGVDDGSEDPIGIFNEICESFDTEYRLPALTRFDIGYQPQLVNPSGEQVQWNELSSGEQILFRIICWLFYYKIDKAVYPGVILMDEPDAHLTPKMIHRFLNNVKDTLVDKLGIAIIMTTHSPNTIALCEEPALYELESTAGVREIKKITRQYALEKFAEGLLFVQVENKLVFVEGSADKPFYTDLHQIAISAHNFKTIPGLAFIAANEADPDHGGCTQVIQMIPRFAGTTLEPLIFGIIDSDNSNRPQDKIAVIDRYSIENFIYDPFITAVNLIIQGNHRGIIDDRHQIGTGEYSRLLDNPTTLQEVVDEILGRIESAAQTAIAASGHGDARVTVEWLVRDGRIVSYTLPEWVLKMKKSDFKSKVIYGRANPMKDLTDGNKQMIAIQTLGAVPVSIMNIFKAIQDNTI